MGYVVDSLCKAVDTLSTQEAFEIMIEGVATVGSWRLELVEYYRDRIQSFGLRYEARSLFRTLVDLQKRRWTFVGPNNIKDPYACD